MPDPTHATISASQAPALWNRSPWLTRFMLHHHFADGLPIDQSADARMSWGQKLEPLILDQARADLSLEVERDQAYVRRGLLGCTRDAIVIDPSLGPGALETKCVFDYRAWMTDWEGGQSAPAHYEIQLQAQMLVGDGRQSFPWGVIAVWVAGEVHYLRREPVEDLWNALETEAAAFFAAVKERREPDPFGAAVELPMLNAIKRTGEVIDLKDNIALAEEARMFNWAKGEATRHGKIADGIKVKLLAALGAASEADLYGGIHLKVRQDQVAEHRVKAGTRTILTVKVPDVLPDELAAALSGKAA